MLNTKIKSCLEATNNDEFLNKYKEIAICEKVKTGGSIDKSIARSLCARKFLLNLELSLEDLQKEGFDNSATIDDITTLRKRFYSIKTEMTREEYHAYLQEVCEAYKIERAEFLNELSID